MADIQHKDILNADTHEPKHITNAVIGDAGKVITPSSVVNGVSVLRYLSETEIADVVDPITVELDDISTASSAWIVAPFSGEVERIYSVIDGAIAVANANISTYINGVAVTGGALTIAFAGSAAGVVDSATPVGNNNIVQGQAFEIRTDGGSTNTVKAQFTVLIRRT